jgi:hypothetical protein
VFNTPEEASAAYIAAIRALHNGAVVGVPQKPAGRPT